MFEAKGINSGRIATLLGSTVTGQMLTHDAAKEVIDFLTCMDDQCDAPLQVVRGTPARRGHFRHVSGTGMACRAPESFGEGQWHKEIKLGVLSAAWKYEYSVPGARADVVVKRRSGSLVALEVQASNIDRETVLKRHAAHRAAGIAGTIWLVDRKHLTRDEDAIKTRFVTDLALACLDTRHPPRGSQATAALWVSLTHRPTRIKSSSWIVWSWRALDTATGYESSRALVTFRWPH